MQPGPVPGTRTIAVHAAKEAVGVKEAVKEAVGFPAMMPGVAPAYLLLPDCGLRCGALTLTLTPTLTLNP